MAMVIAMEWKLETKQEHINLTTSQKLSRSKVGQQPRGTQYKLLITISIVNNSVT